MSIVGKYTTERGNGPGSPRQDKMQNDLRDALATKIRHALDAEGISYVLADILNDPKEALERFSKS